MSTNGATTSMQLSEIQIQQLVGLLSPYLGQLQQAESQAQTARQNINAIASAYLAGLGLPINLNIDLKTGQLSEIQIQQKVAEV